MLSVLVVSPHPSVTGGVTVFIECMKRHLRAAKVDSFFVGSPGRIEGVKKENLAAQMMRLISAPVYLALRVLRGSYDVVHINPSLNTKALLRDCLLLLGLRLIGFRRIIFYIHGWDFSVQNRLMRSSILRPLFAWLLNGVALITVLGSTFRDGLIALGVDAGRIVVTRTMYDSRELDAVRDEVAAVSHPYILFMSRFDAEKGGGELLHAFAAVRQAFAGVHLVLAGSGDQDHVWRALAHDLGIENEVQFTGYVGGILKARLLRDCQVFCLPTSYRSEGMPVAVLEAMGAGKPILVGAAGAIREIVTDPENGVVLDQVTSQTVEVGLRRLLGDSTFCRQAGARNFEIAKTRYAAPIVTAEIEALYQKVAQC